MPSAEFEPAIPAINQLHTYAVYRTATGNGTLEVSLHAFLTPALDASGSSAGAQDRLPPGKEPVIFLTHGE